MIYRLDFTLQETFPLSILHGTDTYRLVDTHTYTHTTYKNDN